MPYIKQHKRDVLNNHISNLCNALVELGLDDPNNNMEGNLNYTITCLLKSLYGDIITSYSDINSIVGVLECVKLEFYRVDAVPYEQTKCIENGDVEPIERERVVLNETLVTPNKNKL